MSRGFATAGIVFVAVSWLQAALDWDLDWGFVVEVLSGLEIQPPVSFLFDWFLLESDFFCDLDQNDERCCLAKNIQVV